MGPLRKEVLSTFLCCRAEWHLRVEENTMIFLGPVIRAKVGLATRFFVLFLHSIYRGYDSVLKALEGLQFQKFTEGHSFLSPRLVLNFWKLACSTKGLNDLRFRLG